MYNKVCINIFSIEITIQNAICNVVWIILNRCFPNPTYVANRRRGYSWHNYMPLLSCVNNEDFITSLSKAIHLQLAFGMNDFLYLLCSLRASYCNFFSSKNWHYYNIGIEALCLYTFCTLLSILSFSFSIA